TSVTRSASITPARKPRHSGRRPRKAMAGRRQNAASPPQILTLTTPAPPASSAPARRPKEGAAGPCRISTVGGGGAAGAPAAPVAANGRGDRPFILPSSERDAGVDVARHRP